MVVAACLIGAAYYWQGHVGDWVSQEVEQHNLSMKNDFMEESRESFGLMIITLVMIPGLIKAWKK
ncbi:transmembrane 220 family protein [Algoriphagus halophilus]|uniref:transmembrane 220 family protein n=1 Tax=Algoriphagus halophilus TaxID=226505 RepID=UPI00358F5C9F